MILFRPVGLEEHRLMYEADMRAFPPRLPDQPIFTRSRTKATQRSGATSLSRVGSDFLLTVHGSRVVLSVAGPPGGRES
ncbi:MAG: hypothetical protein ABI183_14175 [Polyangiaceae bacterium]